MQAAISTRSASGYLRETDRMEADVPRIDERNHASWHKRRQKRCADM